MLEGEMSEEKSSIFDSAFQLLRTATRRSANPFSQYYVYPLNRSEHWILDFSGMF